MAANIPETPYRALGAEILDFGKPYTGPYPHNFDSKGSCLFSLRYTVGFRSRTRFKVNGALQEAESCVELSPCGHRPRFKVTLCNAEEVFRGKAPREQDSPSAAWGECCKWRNNQTGKSTSASESIEEEAPLCRHSASTMRIRFTSHTEVHLPGHMTVTTAPGASQDWAMHDDLLMLESIDQLYKWDDQLAAHTKKLLQHPEEDLDAEQIKERQLMLVELKLRREQIERVVRSMS
ncbi:hypothetical protein WJX73_004047 [Symbiochloris irregularis]|uniref:Uncharacterized protein n=1 Tax=Symbiochloris irregularis TaxID=706552 RepID=A0AAW1P5M7_9CHLO